MPASFARTTRALEDRGGGGILVGLVLAAVVLGWLGWFVLARVRVQEVSVSARLEARSAAHPVTAEIAGRVVETRLVIGRAVRAGEELVRLDAEAERLAINEHAARRDGCRMRLQALQDELAAEREALRTQVAARGAALAEARAQVAAAEARARNARALHERLVRLRARTAASAEELDSVRAAADASQADVRAQVQGLDRLEQDRAALESDRRARLARLDREARELEGNVQVEEARIRRLEHLITLRSIRAPVAGRVGEVAARFRPGSYVPAGERLGAIVPAGPAQAVAYFTPAVLGRLRPGQPARLRLDAYPWMQYGTVPARVVRVGNEPSGGLIRADLELRPDALSAIPMEHGLAGSVEIERVAPAELVLRAAGQLVAPRAGPAPGAVAAVGARGDP